MEIDELENLKYHELQKLAKAKGIRANMKVEKLRKALKDHYDYESPVSDITTDQSSSTDHDSEKEHSPKVKKTRGRKGRKKKKDIDTSNDEDTSDEKKIDEEEQAIKQAGGKKTRKKKVEIQSKSPIPKKAVKASTLKSPFSNIKSPAVRKSTPALGVKSSKSTPTTFRSPGLVRKQPFIKSPKVDNKTSNKELPPKRKRSNSKDDKKEIVEHPDDFVDVEPSKKRLRKTSSSPKVNTPSKTSKKSPLNNTPNNFTPKHGTRKSSSPGVKSMIQAMDGLSSEQMKATLLDALDKKVSEDKSPAKSSQASNIPRFTACLGQNSEKVDQKKTNTPDWKKIHKKEFSRWDNLEVYMEKRKKRAEGLTGSFKSVHKLLKETQTAVDRLKNTKTPQIVKPVKKDSIRSSFQSPNVFKPSTISTKNLNLKFDASKTPVVQSNTKTPRNSTATKKPTPKSSTRTVTPSARTVTKTSCGVKSSKLSITPKSNLSKRAVSHQSTNKPNTPLDILVKPRSTIKPSSTIKSSPHCNSSLINITHKSNKLSIGDGFTKEGTPLKLKGLNTSVLNCSMKKSSFDLKASLSRPMSWKPHKGKLKPLDLNTAYRTFDKTSYKTPQTQTIKDRRRGVQANRADKKFESQMRRRGVSLA